MSYKYISIKKFGSPEVLEMQTAKQLPEPKDNEVRIKVLRTSAAFTDTLIRRGIYPDVRKKPPITLGYDLIGRIDKVGKNVSAIKVRQKVVALTTIGAYAQYICLPASEVVLVPENLDLNDALSMVLTFTTAYQMITRCAKLKNGQKVLVHGAGGAVGSALLQIGQLMNLKMYGTASKSKHNFIEQLGGILLTIEMKILYRF